MQLAPATFHFSHEQNLSPLESWDLHDASVTVGDEFGLFSHLGVQVLYAQKLSARGSREGQRYYRYVLTTICTTVLVQYAIPILVLSFTRLTTQFEYEAQAPNVNGRS